MTVNGVGMGAPQSWRRILHYMLPPWRVAHADACGTRVRERLVSASPQSGEMFCELRFAMQACTGCAPLRSVGVMGMPAVQLGLSSSC